MLSLALSYENGILKILDQTRLPSEEAWETVTHPDQMISHIKRLAVRGAPLIGVAAAVSLADFVKKTKCSREDFLKIASRMREARPTAVNLSYAVDRLLNVSMNEIPSEAEKIFDEDVDLCRKIAEKGAALISDGDGVLTHCNSGGLATAGVGTALGVILTAHQQNKRIHVFVDETRPLLQGARLTAWELKKHGIPFTVLTDSMASIILREGKVAKIFVGADRIARNGDAANKVGTYQLAVTAKYHGVPFYVVAPRSTLDESIASGKEIPIEMRGQEEVSAHFNSFNPSFDVTPRELITDIILE